MSKLATKNFQVNEFDNEGNFLGHYYITDGFAGLMPVINEAGMKSGIAIAQLLTQGWALNNNQTIEIVVI